MLRISNLNLVVLTSKFNYLHRGNNSDFLVPQAPPFFESDINYFAENSILIVSCNK